MNKRISIILILLLMVGAGYAQPLNVARLDSFFQILETKNKFMGSVTVSENGKLVYAKSL